MKKFANELLPELWKLSGTPDERVPVTDEWCIAHALGSGGQAVVLRWARTAHTVPCQWECPPGAVGELALNSGV